MHHRTRAEPATRSPSYGEHDVCPLRPATVRSRENALWKHREEGPDLYCVFFDNGYQCFSQNPGPQESEATENVLAGA